MDQTPKALTIQQVSQRTGVTKHTLRFWENELGGILVPLRTKGRQRRYSMEHLYVIEEIKRLKDRGLTLEDIRSQMSAHGSRRDSVDPAQGNIDFLADRIAEVVRSVVYSFFENERKGA